MLIFEWWAYEILNIFCGWSGVNDQAVSVITISILSILFMFVLGIAYSSTSLIGNSLGANCPNNAKKYYHATMITALALIGVLIV
jgi:MATE family multidrug resistance protein